MTEPVLPDYAGFLAVLSDILMENAGTPLQMRDEGLLRSAFARPQHLAAYGRAPHPCEGAAALAFGITRNHPLVDGNKRAAAAAFLITLLLNGLRLDVTQIDLAERFEALAGGALDEAALAQWARDNTVSDSRFSKPAGA
jgi:death on curing protein